ncbi:MAG TPA: hypothetical protein VLX09_09030 [Stellaceae bacterium]|nr:hypothetical protein [Stellaceae bacterium]
MTLLPFHRAYERQAQPLEPFPPLAVILHDIGLILSALLSVAVAVGTAMHG